MFSNSKLTKRDKITIISLIAVLVIAVSVIVGLVAAKYVTQVHLDGSIKVSAELASSIEVYEHKAGRTDDGDYTLDDNTEVTTNDYTLMPGVDVPKDPAVRIKDYTGIDAWVYVEVIETNFPTETTVGGERYIDYKIKTGWTALTKTNEQNEEVQVTGPNHGAIYYKKITADDLPTGENAKPDVVLQILDPEIIKVSQWIERETDDVKLQFTAYIIQKTSDDPAEDYAKLGL